VQVHHTRFVNDDDGQFFFNRLKAGEVEQLTLPGHAKGLFFRPRPLSDACCSFKGKDACW